MKVETIRALLDQRREEVEEKLALIETAQQAFVDGSGKPPLSEITPDSPIPMAFGSSRGRPNTWVVNSFALLPEGSGKGREDLGFYSSDYPKWVRQDYLYYDDQEALENFGLESARSSIEALLSLKFMIVVRRLDSEIGPGFLLRDGARNFNSGQFLAELTVLRVSDAMLLGRRYALAKNSENVLYGTYGDVRISASSAVEHDLESNGKKAVCETLIYMGATDCEL